MRTIALPSFERGPGADVGLPDANPEKARVVDSAIYPGLQQTGTGKVVGWKRWEVQVPRGLTVVAVPSSPRHNGRAGPHKSLLRAGPFVSAPRVPEVYLLGSVWCRNGCDGQANRMCFAPP